MTLVLTYPCYYFRSFSATDFAFDPIFLILRFNKVKIFILWCLPRAFFTIIKYYCFSEFCVCPFNYISFFSSTDFVFDLIFSFSGVKVLISWGLSREFFTIKHYYCFYSSYVCPYNFLNKRSFFKLRRNIYVWMFLM